jgi:hypothetical protein
LSDVDACRVALREEIVHLLEELGLDVAHDPAAQARLDAAMADALSELHRLTGGLPDAT